MASHQQHDSNHCHHCKYHCFSFHLFKSIIIKCTAHHIPTRIREPHWVIEAVAVPVVSLRALLVLDHDVGREHTAEDGVVETAVHVDEFKRIVVLVEGVATAENMAHVVVAEDGGIATPAPSGVLNYSTASL